MTDFSKILTAGLAACLLAACEPDTCPAIMVDRTDVERTALSLDLDLGTATKTSLLSGSEAVSSGATVYVFYSGTGKLDSVHDISPDGTTTVTVPSGVPIDMLVTGNLWAVNRSDGSKGNLLAALGASFPTDRSGVEALQYILDGGAINDSWRRETFAEVASYGIPYSGRREGITVSAGMQVTLECTRLFAKVSLTVDHSGLDGGKDDAWFRNGKCYLRQANGRIAPFSEDPQKASSPVDVIEGDFDPDMSNSHRMTFTFYVPENMQGTLLPSNTDQNAKSYDNVVSAVGDEVASRLTYVEFSGTIDSSAGGYGGDVVYRFYLGEDNVTNFDLCRGRNYDVILGFRVNSLFDPWWQVTTGSLSDSRRFCLTADEAGTVALPDAQMVAVRKSRPGKVYVYMNPDGSLGSNSLRGRSPVDPDYSVSDLSDFAWTSDFLSATNASSQVPRLADLAAMGITASYDASSSLLTFSVTDPSKFAAGEECDLTLRLLPGGRTVSLKVRSYDEMSVVWNKSTTDGFYTAMERTATFVGYSGPVRYSSTRSDILKYAATTDDSSFIGDWSDSQRAAGGSMSVYAWTGPGTDFRMDFTPEDSFNDGDGTVSTDMKVCTPVLLFRVPGRNIYIYVTGEYDYAQAFYYALGVDPSDPSDSYMIPLGDFNKTLYYSLLDYDYQLGLNPTEADRKAYEATFQKYSDDSSRTHGNYRSYSLCRKALFSSNCPGCIDAVFCGARKGYDLYAVSANGIVSSNCSPLWLMPLMDSESSISFAETYHDYTLLDASKLDEPYSTAATSYVSDGREYFYVGKSSPNLSLIAVPTDPGSDGYSEGVSQSVEVSLDEDTMSRIRISFKDSETIRHSAGPHEIRATVTNKRSGETMTGAVGTFKVYVDFVVGVDLELEYLGDTQADFRVWPVMLSAVSRTSCGTWFAGFGVSTDDAETQTLSYEVYDTTLHDYVKVASGTKVQKSPTFAHYEEPFYDLYTVSLKKEDSYTGFAFDEIDEAGFMERFGGQIWLLATNGDPKTEVNVIVDGMKDDDNGGVGYYTFHRLKDLCSSSRGWVKLYNAL